MKRFLVFVLTILSTPVVGLAHPGHGSTDGYTITHYFVEPEHAIFTWSFLVASFFLISFYKLKRKRSG